MDIEYTYQINGLKVSNLAGLPDVVKEVEYTLIGKSGDISFSLPNRVVLGDADPTTFVAFSGLTEAQLITWLEGAGDVVASQKAHIEYVMAREVERAALQSKPLPWAPPAPAPELAPAE